MANVGTETYTVSGNALFVPADPKNPKIIRNIGGGSLYYKTTSAVSASDSSIASGSSVAVGQSGYWIIATAALPATILIEYIGDDPVPITRWFSKPMVQASTDGTNTAGHTTTVFLTQIFVGQNCTLTGGAVMNGDAQTDKYVIAIFNSLGAPLGSTAVAGTAASGSDDFQEIAFISPVTVRAGAYWFGLYTNGTTVRFNTYPTGLLGMTQGCIVGSVTGQTFGTVAKIVPPTAQVADKGPISYFY